MKFTVKEFRAALKANDKTLVWKLAAISLRHTPERKDVFELIKKHSNTIRDSKKAYSMAYDSQRKQRIQAAETMAWYKRGAYGQYGETATDPASVAFGPDSVVFFFMFFL